MKVLKNNYNVNQDDYNPYNPIESYPKKFVCEHCSSEIEYDKEDVCAGAYGCAVIKCPLCGYENYLDEEDGITLTMDNIEFPTHFSHTSAKTGAVDCCNNEEIKKYIRKAINYLRDNKDEDDYGGHITGNLYLHVHKWEGDGDYEITVSNDFYDSYIQFESADY